MQNKYGGALAVLAMTTSGCYLDGDTLLVVNWHINGVDDAQECTQNLLSHAHIVVSSPTGIEDEREVDCDAFRVEFELPPGGYWATVALRNDQRDDRTVTLQTESRELYEHDTALVSVDFGKSSFLDQ